MDHKTQGFGKRKVSHPKFDRIYELPTHIVVCFKVGRHVYPPQPVQEAQHRIRAALATIAPRDMELVQSWNGAVKFYETTSKTDNPETTEAMRQEFIDAAQATFPELKVLQSWDNSMQSLNGFSVQMAAGSAA